MKHNSIYFYGHKISNYGIESGYVDYNTLAKAFDAVLNNNIIENTYSIGCWEQISGYKDDDVEAYYEIFQYYIISDNGVKILQEADEIVYYNNVLNMYVWGVTHWGTSWDYVLTNIELEV